MNTMIEGKELSLDSLKEANLPRLKWRELFKCDEAAPLSVEDVIAMDEYFSQFLKPEKGCVKCGKPQTGSIVDQFLGNAQFTWGIANGEGFCANCKYPARAYHRKVGPIDFLNMVLQYHPNELREAHSVPSGV